MSVIDATPERWAKRLTLGLPVVATALIITSMLLIGTILNAGDLRAQYEQLLSTAQSDLTAAAPAAPAEAAPAATAPDERPELTVELRLTEMAIEADVTEIPAWATVTFEVTNDGAIAHDAVVDRKGTPMLASGESASFTVDAPGSGTLEVLCTVSGHAAAGMTLELPIVGGEEPADSQVAQAAEADLAAFASPDNADAYTGDKPELEVRDPVLPPAVERDVHDVTFTVEERVMQVAEGVWQEVWTYNGLAPGPTLRMKVGETLDLTLVNPEDQQVAHSIDFHASHVAWNDEMRSIDPGEELDYVFTPKHAGVYMYHCGTAPAVHHIGNQMHGLIIVEPAEGLPAVDHEFAFVQSEYYLGPQGEPGDLTKMMAAAPAPDLVTFNGVANQYLDHPIEVGVDERIRVWFVNNGPSVDSSFHVVGSIFDTVVKEGVKLEPGNEGSWGSQAVDLAPAQGAYVEFTLDVDGLYPFVTHAFNFVGRGAIGLFQAGTGGEGAAGGH